MPAPRILRGPFRNVDPHTASLAVYFRGPASELFNMLNPESPGAISVLARTCTLPVYHHVRASLRLCEDVRVLFLSPCRLMCMCSRARETITSARAPVYVLELYITRTSLGHALPAAIPHYTSAIAHVSHRATLQELAHHGGVRSRSRPIRANNLRKPRVVAEREISGSIVSSIGVEKFVAIS